MKNLSDDLACAKFANREYPNPTNAHMKIILADDDAISRKIIAGFLARFGYQVQVVKDGTEA